MGYPVVIEHKKYQRNSLFFNVGFVFSKQHNHALEVFQPVLQKLANTFRALEEESEYLFNPKKKATLLEILPRVLQELNSNKMCYIPVDNSNVISLRIFPKAPVLLSCTSSQAVVPVIGNDSCENARI
jgi:nitrogen permease regulator 2-like protein